MRAAARCLWAWNSVPPQAAGVTADGTYRRSTANTWSVFSVDDTAQPRVHPDRQRPGGPVRHHARHRRARLLRRFGRGTGCGQRQGACGTSRPCTTTSGTTTCPRSRCCSISRPRTGPVAALAQPTKQGYLFILNRETGEPLVPVEERPAPQQWAVEGEHLAPTQPVPTNETYVLQRPKFTEADMWGFTPWDRGKCRDLFRRHNYEGAFSAPSLQGHHHLSGQPGRDELGQRCDRPGAQPARHQHQPRGHGCAAGAARAGG